MAPLLQQCVALELESAGPHRLACQEDEAVLVVEGWRPALVPFVPAGHGGLAHGGVENVGAVIHADDLADVGAGGFVPGHAAGVEHRDRPAAPPEFAGGGQSEHSRADK